MRYVAVVLSALVVASTLGACGGQRESRSSSMVMDADGFNLRMGVEPLPEGHPPLDGHAWALPEGHPPVPGYSPGLPEGHPVCPAREWLPESSPPGDWDGQGSAQDLIST
jgi:hypothetical protein